MGDIDLRKNSAGTKLSNFASSRSQLHQFTIDYAELLTEKGSALAATDVVQIMAIPAGCIVQYAGVTPLVIGDSTTLTLDLGDTTTADLFVNGCDGAALTDGVPIMTVAKYYPAASIFEMELKTLTGTLTTGKVRVWIHIMEASIL